MFLAKHLINHPTVGVNSMLYWLTALGFVMGPKRIRGLLSDGQTDPVSKEKSDRNRITEIHSAVFIAKLEY